MFVSLRGAMVSQFVVEPTFKRWFLKTIQVTKKHVPFNAILHWSLKLIVKQRIWTTGCTFPTNESA